MTRFTRGDQRQRSLHVTIGLLTVVVGTIIALSGVGRSLAANNMGTMRSTATASKMGHTASVRPTGTLQLRRRKAALPKSLSADWHNATEVTQTSRNLAAK